MELSNNTRAKAYLFVKSLLSDGADGQDVHKLVGAISENINEEVGGSILMDLLKNPEEASDEKKKHTHWMGPFHFTWFNVITEAWADYCEDHEIRGTFRFGGDDEWDQWRKQRISAGERVPDGEEWRRKKNNARDQIIVYEYWADPIEANDIMDWCDRFYEGLMREIKANADK